MSHFYNRPLLRLVSDDPCMWELVEALYYRSDLLGRTIVVPPGFKTDLASVPRLPLVFWLTGDTSQAAAVVHDYLYDSREVSRKMADDILREASAVTGVPGWRRFLMWAGVRLGGASRYDPDTVTVPPEPEH